MNIKKIALSNKCKTFLHEVETQYKGKICIVEKEMGRFEQGRISFIKESNYCECVIYINVNALNKPLTLIHEVYHLKNRLDGLIIARINSNNEEINFFMPEFWNLIEHHLFFPKMGQNLNLDPYKYSKELLVSDLSNVFKNESFSKPYFCKILIQAYVETNDINFVEEIVSKSKDKASSEIISVGLKLVDLFKDNFTNNTTEICHSVFKKIYSELFSDHKIIRTKYNETDCMWGVLKEETYFIND